MVRSILLLVEPALPCGPALLPPPPRKTPNLNCFVPHCDDAGEDARALIVACRHTLCLSAFPPFSSGASVRYQAYATVSLFPSPSPPLISMAPCGCSVSVIVPDDKTFPSRNPPHSSLFLHWSHPQNLPELLPLTECRILLSSRMNQ